MAVEEIEGERVRLLSLKTTGEGGESCVRGLLRRLSLVIRPGSARRFTGEMLREEFLKPLGLTQVETARELGMSVNRLNELVLGKRGVTADTALRLARRFKTTPQFWMHLQADWDLHQAKGKTSAA